MKTPHLYPTDTYVVMAYQRKELHQQPCSYSKLLSPIKNSLLRLMRFWLHGLTIIGNPWLEVVKSNPTKTKEDKKVTLQRTEEKEKINSSMALSELFFYLYVQNV